MTEISKKALHLDELGDFHIRGLENLEPGLEVIFGHVPTLVRDFMNPYEFKAFPQYVHGVITEVQGNLDSSDIHSPHPVIHYKNFDNNTLVSRFASDSGVIPYKVGYYNATNFVVSLAALREAGVEFIPTVSQDYEARRIVYNESIVESDYGFTA